MGLRKKVDLTPIWEEAPLRGKGVCKKFKRYRDSVDYHTEKNKDLIEGIETRGYLTFHIDHKISAKWGFDNNVPSKVIAHLDNLRMFWGKDNICKNKKNVIDDSNKWIFEKYVNSNIDSNINLGKIHDNILLL